MIDLGGEGSATVNWSLVLLAGAAVLGIVLLIGLLNLLDNRRTRGFVTLFLVLPLLALSFLAVTGRVVHVRSRAAVPASGDGDVTVVLSPPDKTDTGKAADDGISFRIQQDEGTGKGMIIFVKANRRLESLGKAFLDAIRHSGEKESEPGKSPAAPTTEVAAAPAGPAAPTRDLQPAKPASAPVSKPTVPPAETQDPTRQAIQVYEAISKSAAKWGAKRRTTPRTASKTGAPAGKALPTDDVAYEETVTAYGRAATDSAAALDDELQLALKGYVQDRLGDEAAERVVLPAGELRKCIASKSQETVDVKGLGPMVCTTALVRFDNAFQTRIDREWVRVRLPERLWYLGGGLGVVLLPLSVGYGYLKIDLATGGAYRWRLRLAAVAILAGMVAAGVAFIP